jgi:hypothetical protein
MLRIALQLPPAAIIMGIAKSGIYNFKIAEAKRKSWRRGKKRELSGITALF